MKIFRRSKIFPTFILSIFLSVVLALAVVPTARAAMPVIDAGAITQLIMQILTLREQLSTAQNQLSTANDQLTTAQDQLRTAEDHLRTLTGELARQQSLRQQANASIGSLRTLPRMGL